MPPVDKTCLKGGNTSAIELAATWEDQSRKNKKCGWMTHARHRLKEDFPRINQRGWCERERRFFLCKTNAHTEALPAHPRGLLERRAPVSGFLWKKIQQIGTARDAAVSCGTRFVPGEAPSGRTWRLHRTHAERHEDGGGESSPNARLNYPECPLVVGCHFSHFLLR